ncbi:MAG: DUF58 domain-containing protein [Candidatus Nanoarchaeia archaeon]|nr:DUF58 domain-containing protein [Candidatus Nanoarchaeia archaeon]MDD5741411.1 DUF58 domain-containing protein [Candidatus Nanoarchaeia archaeon]
MENKQVERKLNLDIAGAVSELETLVKKVLPKNVMYQLLLSKGLEFDGYRDYTQNDDAGLIDWKASIRGRKLFVRKYIEERDLKFIFIIDVSDNMIFGSTEKLKCEYTAEFTAALVHLILTTGDRVGFFLFNDNIVKSRPLELGNRQFDIFVDHISDPLNYGGISNLNKVLDGIIDMADRSTSMVFLISDFINVDESYKRKLESLASLFETVAIIVRDPLDMILPEINKEIVIEDTNTGEKLLINPEIARGIYGVNATNQLNSLKEIFKNSNIDFLELSTDKSASVEIAGFLRERIRGGRIVRIKNVH